MDKDATSYGSRPRPRPHCVIDGDPAPPRERGTAAPSFRPISIVGGHGRPSQLLLSSCTNGRAKKNVGRVQLASD